MIKSIWSEYELKEYPKLNKDIKTDVLIIGGGISGILCAYYLRESGRDVIVVEADRVCSKKSRKTTAVITALQDVMYNELPRAKAKQFLNANLFALDEYKKLANKFDFDFEECSSYKYSKDSAEEIEEEHDYLLSLGINIKYVKDLGLPVKFEKAIELENQGQMNPIKLVKELSKNIKLYEQSPIRKIKDNEAFTDTNKIEFSSVVVCTGYPFLKLKGLFPLKLHQEKSHVISVNDTKGFKGNGVGTSDDDIYFRNYKDELLLGACDIKTGNNCDGFIPINDFIVKHFNIKKVNYRWINEDTVSLDKLPYIGKYGSSDNMYVTTGYNLWGMTGSMLGAHVITDLINGKNNCYSELFSPSRKVLARPLFENIKTAIKNLISFKKKRCTHLGCRLHYNNVDQTYECECHGSKFDSKGNVIDTPAQKRTNI